MFGMEKDDEQDPKAQVLQEILDYAREKMVGAAKKGEPEGEMSVEISTEEEPKMGLEKLMGEEGGDEMEGEGKACPHCGKPC